MEAKSQTLNCQQLQKTGTEIQDDFRCPSCNIKLQLSQVAQHCEMEIERLRQMQTDASTKLTEIEETSTERRKPYSVFQRVQRNRQTRLKQRTRKRSTPPAPALEHPCPVCNVSYAHSEIQRHAEQCLRKSNGLANGGDNSSNDDDDEDGGEEYEEYEWAGHKRIRVSSLLEGGYAGLGIGQSITNRNGAEDDEDEDLNVDEDDTQIYGPAQYDEADVIPTTTQRKNGNTTTAGTVVDDDDDEDVTSYMRSLITGGAKSAAHHTLPKEVANEVNDDSNVTATTTDKKNELPSSSTAAATSALSSAASICTSSTSSTKSHYQQIIDSLKAKLRQYEHHVPSKFKCLICLDDYRKPAISVSCWHVHCEECWLRSLGARKLCPQCNLITTPKDLRRIYM